MKKKADLKVVQDNTKTGIRKVKSLGIELQKIRDNFGSLTSNRILKDRKNEIEKLEIGLSHQLETCNAEIAIAECIARIKTDVDAEISQEVCGDNAGQVEVNHHTGNEVIT